MHQLTLICILRALLLTVTAPLLASTSQSVAADRINYLCIADETAGLHYDRSTKEWGPKIFRPGGKYVFRYLTPDDRDDKKSKWAALLRHREKANRALFEFGKKDAIPEATCEDGEYSLECTGVVAEFKFDDRSLRFEIVRSGSYVGQAIEDRLRRERPELKTPGNPDEPDDLIFEIGKCNAL